MAQSLNAAWRKDPPDGERRAARLGELAQMAFAEMRALLHELMPGEEPHPASHSQRPHRCTCSRARCSSSTVWRPP